MLLFLLSRDDCTNYLIQQKFPVQWSPNENGCGQIWNVKCSFLVKHHLQTKPGSTGSVLNSSGKDVYIQIHNR